MIRHLAYLAPLAVLGLAACSGPAQLTKAKEGECFTVVGREPGGAPKLEQTECLTSVRTEPGAPVETPTEVAAVEAAAPAVCPTAPAVCPTVAAPAPAKAKRHAARAERRSAHRVAQRTHRSHTVERNTEVRQRDYARVYTPDYPQQELLGAPTYREDRYEHSYRSRPAPSLPPPPPVERYERREGHAYGERQYGQHEEYRPREPRDHAYRGEERAYRDHPPAPPPAYDHGRDRDENASRYSRDESQSSRQYERRSHSSSSSSSSSSYGGSSYGSGHGDGYNCPDRCPPRGGPVMAPMNGPHFPVDADGFLTWRGKSR